MARGSPHRDDMLRLFQQRVSFGDPSHIRATAPNRDVFSPNLSHLTDTGVYMPTPGTVEEWVQTISDSGMPDLLADHLKEMACHIPGTEDPENPLRDKVIKRPRYDGFVMCTAFMFMDEVIVNQNVDWKLELFEGLARMNTDANNCKVHGLLNLFLRGLVSPYRSIGGSLFFCILCMLSAGGLDSFAGEFFPEMVASHALGMLLGLITAQNKLNEFLMGLTR